jgi:hypothetical protein
VTDSSRPLRRLTRNVININTAKWIAVTMDLGHFVETEEREETKLGVDGEYDRLVFAFNEIADISKEAKRRAREVLAQYGLAEHGFDVVFGTGYAPRLDKHRSADTPAEDYPWEEEG